MTTPHRTPDLAAAILIGGRSRRMGTDKALLRLHDAGPTVIETVATVTASVADEVFLIGDRAQAYAFLGLPSIDDLVANAGALAGIHAALAASTRSHLLVVGCDMPFLNADLLRFMRDLPRDYDVLVPVLEQPHPLHAIYAASCLPLIEANLSDGHRRVMGWWDEAKVREIPQAEIARHDPTLRSCFNMNTPDDLAVARHIANGRSS
jgi:molybdopterin-guanine dinucleotide biosynthesis protein A